MLSWIDQKLLKITTESKKYTLMKVNICVLAYSFIFIKIHVTKSIENNLLSKNSHILLPNLVLCYYLYNKILLCERYL